MGKGIGKGKTWLLGLVVLMLWETEARAYSDPGSGALLWQVLLAGIFGLLYYGRKFLHRLGWGKNNREEQIKQPENE